MKENSRPDYPVLIVDDEESILLSVDTTLRMAGFENIITCQDSRQVMDLILAHHAEVILLDLNMPHISGQNLLMNITADFPDIPVIIVTGAADVDMAVHCIKKGAFDYLVKPVDAERLLTSVQQARSFNELQRENISLKNHILTDEIENREAFSEIITGNRKMLSIFKYIESIAGTSQAVLITGETGVGKELISKALHKLSGLRGPFVTVNVAGLDDNIFSDTLFGHVKGAFTGAETHRKGLIDQASGGTLLLDEIGDLSITSQVKLLRLLQEGEYRSLGMDETRSANVRIVASTNKDLVSLQNLGTFRKDLLFRLKIHHVHIPPLRKRLDDIPLLLDHFLDEAAREFGVQQFVWPRELPLLLQTYSFPGNIREMQAMIYDAVSRHKSKMLSMAVFEKYITRQRKDKNIEALPAASNRIIFPFTLPTIEEATEKLVAEAMKRAEGNQSMAARMLGISQQAVNKRLQKMKENSGKS
ncbi:MAG: sigma-54 dependent transcriptional regulator [Desulfobacterales bacterium]